MKKHLIIRRRITNGLVMILLCIAVSSCATIFTGTKQKIKVNGNIQTPVQIFADGRIYKDVRLPTKVKIRRKNEPSTVAALSAAHKMEKQELHKTMNWVVIFDAFPIPVFSIVDWATGANKKHRERNIYFNFNPAVSDREISDANIDFGMEYFKLGKLPQALEYFRRAYEIDPDNIAAKESITAVSDAYINTGMGYFEKNSMKKALSYFETAYNVDPDNAAASENIAAANGRINELAYQAELKKERRRERRERTLEIMQVVGAGLGAAANVAAAAQGQSTESYSSAAGSYSSNESSGGANCSNYQFRYDNLRNKVNNDQNKMMNLSNKTTGDKRVINQLDRQIRSNQKLMNNIWTEAYNAGCPIK